jgi:hypothetical protein
MAANDAQTAAQVQRWLSVASGQINNGPARARLITVFGAGFDPADTIDRAHAVLQVIETHLKGRQFLAADHATIADVSAYSYIAHAPEGNVSLEHVPERAGLAEAYRRPRKASCQCLVPRWSGGLDSAVNAVSTPVLQSRTCRRSILKRRRRSTPCYTFRKGSPRHERHHFRKSSPWHEGEIALQGHVGVAERMGVMGKKVIRDYMPDQHREFYEHLPYLFIGAVDEQGWPWASLLDANAGFIASPDPRHLEFSRLPDAETQAARTIHPWRGGGHVGHRSSHPSAQPHQWSYRAGGPIGVFRYSWSIRSATARSTFNCASSSRSPCPTCRSVRRSSG